MTEGVEGADDDADVENVEGANGEGDARDEELRDDVAGTAAELETLKLRDEDRLELAMADDGPATLTAEM